MVPSSVSKENGFCIGQKSDGRDLKKSYVWLVAAAILALSASNSVVGQDGPGAWSVSISDENGEVQEITLSDKGGASIPILVENNGITSITVSLDCTSPFDAQVSCPGDVTVTAGENTTVYGVISDVDVLNYAANANELFEVTGTVIARQGVPIALPGDTASDDVQMVIPEVFNLVVRIDDPAGPMNAGADTILRVFVQNNGNIADRVSETDVSVDCTLITVGTQTSEITNKEVAPGATISANLVFEAALSHPSRSCDVDIQIVSQGSDGSQTSTDSTRIEVQAATGESGGKEPVDEGSGTVEVVTTGLPHIGVVGTGASLFIAAFMRRKL
ncbi:MAG: hypothetical protein VYD89_03665 [Candidatus Thermoplasmatota archaeon]|nr:hypothetical protein [Candidatus Thermoplasmatota archaeon]